MSYNLGFIGGGNMSTAIVQGILRNGKTVIIVRFYLRSGKPWMTCYKNLTAYVTKCWHVYIYFFHIGDHPASKIWVSGPHLENLLHWKEFGANITNKNGEIYSTCDMIFLGIKPQVLSKAISDCYNTLPPNMPLKKVLFVSILAGTNIEQLHKVWPFLHISL